LQKAPVSANVIKLANGRKSSAFEKTRRSFFVQDLTLEGIDKTGKKCGGAS
jgi:hypothetical protein